MRKMLLVSMVLLMAAPVFAGNVTMSVADKGLRWASIRYSADANVSGFGLKVYTADPNKVAKITDIADYNVGESNSVKKGYGIFPGSIVIDDNGDVNDYNRPLAKPGSPGTTGTGLDTNTVVVELGALYVDGNQPPLSGTLLSVKVDGDCNVCVTGEPIRGKVVLTDANQATMVGDPVCARIALPAVVRTLTVTAKNPDATAGAVAITVAPNDNDGNGNGTTQFTRLYNDATVVSLTAPASINYGGSPYNFKQWNKDSVLQTTNAATTVTMDANHTMQAEYDCFPNDDPNYAQWGVVGKPCCWCYPRQCRGDADGAPYGKSNWWVASPDLTIMTNAWQIAGGPLTTPGLCADFDRKAYGKANWRVAAPDLTVLTNNWQQANGPAGTCVPATRSPSTCP